MVPITTTAGAGGAEVGPEGGSRTRILLVDPYGHSREGLGASLRGGGLSVETAEGSADAVRKMKEGAFALAIVDLDLPPARGTATDGWDLARMLRAVNPELPMIFIAAECRPDTKAEAARYRAAHLLEKPINPRGLRDIVRDLCKEAAGT